MALVVTPYALEAYLNLVAGRADTSEFIEVRRRTSGAMTSAFFSVEEPERAGVYLLEHARRTDVYVGCAPRSRRAGTKDAVSRVWTLWAECDGAGSVEALKRFDPTPSFIIGSGSGVNCHAYWPLVEPLTPAAAEEANLRIATALGADLACFDASRILRPPGTWNHKHRPPTRVATLHLERDRRFDSASVLRHVPEISTERLERRWAPPPGRAWEDDPLLNVEPAVYVTELIGRRPGRNHKVACPFHEDQTPSLHVFPTPERGWCCFSCGRGGSIYDLAAAMWGTTTRGREFVELREHLQERFAAEVSRPRLSHVLER
jgi:hypothetical protein